MTTTAEQAVSIDWQQADTTAASIAEFWERRGFPPRAASDRMASALINAFDQVLGFVPDEVYMRIAQLTTTVHSEGFAVGWHAAIEYERNRRAVIAHQ